MISKDVRRIILEQSKRANVGHIGSALSIADILTTLYSRVLNIPDFHDENRDRFILSKGHAALALYAVLYLKGWITKDALENYCGDGTSLGVHPEQQLPGVDFSSGSLGHGLPMGAGAALAARLQGSERKIFVLISDAECNEGSTWEAAMFAAHHQLSNLIAILDCNGQQAFGYTNEVLNLSPLADRWRAFQWEVHEVDGHNIPQMIDCISSLNTRTGAPKLIFAHTIFGKGVSYMQQQIQWHYLPMSEDQYQQALRESDSSS